MNYNVTVNGKVYSVTVEKTGAAAPAAVRSRGRPCGCRSCGRPRPRCCSPARSRACRCSCAPAAAPAAVAAGETAVNSPMPGNIFKVECSVGQSREGWRRAGGAGGHEDGDRGLPPCGRHRQGLWPPLWAPLSTRTICWSPWAEIGGVHDPCLVLIKQLLTRLNRLSVR